MYLALGLTLAGAGVPSTWAVLNAPLATAEATSFSISIPLFLVTALLVLESRTAGPLTVRHVTHDLVC